MELNWKTPSWISPSFRVMLPDTASCSLHAFICLLTDWFVLVSDPTPPLSRHWFVTQLFCSCRLQSHISESSFSVRDSWFSELCLALSCVYLCLTMLACVLTCALNHHDICWASFNKEHTEFTFAFTCILQIHYFKSMYILYGIYGMHYTSYTYMNRTTYCAVAWQ